MTNKQSPLVPLVYPHTIRNPSDIARLRAILNTRGYDATDFDIQAAYADWRMSFYDRWGTAPESLDKQEDGLMFEVLYERMNRTDGRSA